MRMHSSQVASAIPFCFLGQHFYNLLSTVSLYFNNGCGLSTRLLHTLHHNLGPRISRSEAELGW